MDFNIYCSFDFADEPHGLPRAYHDTKEAFNHEKFKWNEAGIAKMVGQSRAVDALLVVDIEFRGPAPVQSLPLTDWRARRWMKDHPGHPWASVEDLISDTVHVVNEGGRSIRKKFPSQRTGIYYAFPPKLPGTFKKIYEAPGTVPPDYLDWLTQNKLAARELEYDMVCPDLYSPWPLGMYEIWAFWAHHVVLASREYRVPIMPYLTLHNGSDPTDTVHPDFLARQIHCLGANGANGAIIWCKYGQSAAAFKPQMDVVRKFT